MLLCNNILRYVILLPQAYFFLYTKSTMCLVESLLFMWNSNLNCLIVRLVIKSYLIQVYRYMLFSYYRIYMCVYIYIYKILF